MAQFMNRILATPDDRDCRYLVDIKQGYVDIDEPYWGSGQTVFEAEIKSVYLVLVPIIRSVGWLQLIGLCESDGAERLDIRWALRDL